MNRKKFYKFTLTAFSVFLILIKTGISEAQNSIVISSVDEALNLALKNNSEVIRAKLDKLKADEKVSEVYSENLVPTTNLNMIFTRSFKKQVLNIFGETFEIGSDNSILTQIEVTEPIPILGTPVFSGIRIAEHYQNIQRENIKRVEADIKNNVKKAYYSVLLDRKSVV